jgi:hypothetical protein
MPFRGHVNVGIIRLDPSNYFAQFRMPRDDRRLSILEARKCGFGMIEAKICLASPRIGAVALITVVGQDRLDVLVEIPRRNLSREE